MAKKTIDSQLSDLEGLKNIPDERTRINELELRAEQAVANSDGRKPKSQFRDYEEWRIEKHIINGKADFVKLAKIKDTRLLPEQAEELNEQKHNSLIEYIAK